MAKKKRPGPKAAAEKRVNLTESCRQLADHVGQVPAQVAASFSSTDPNQRTARLMEYGNQLLFDALPYLTWLERTKHPDVAKLEKARILFIADNAVACAACEQSKLADDELHVLDPARPFTPAERLLIELFAITDATATNLRNWAEEIEAVEKLPSKAHTANVAASPVSTNEERDEWIYQQKKEGRTHGQIRSNLAKNHQDWYHLESDQAVGLAADRYAQRKNLPKLRRKK